MRYPHDATSLTMSQVERILLTASLTPDELALAQRAFDEAWALIASNYIGRGAILTGRTRLATFVLSAMSEGSRDAIEIRDAAVRMTRQAEEPVPFRKPLS
jgi:hypothetical protein